MRKQIIEILDRVRPELCVAPDQNTPLFGVLDSLDIILMVDELEKVFGITVPADRIVPETFASVDALEAFVHSCLT